ncbi:MAG: hypothetical protein MUF54_05635, partial [Polyangiaceae bacterium]|nr:hypothetical protein [Polyangiaceae bacterium]
MRARSLLFLASAAAVVAGGCEDGPEQVFTPNAGNPLQQNGIDKGPAWVEPGDKQFANTSEDTDKEGRAVFCGEAEQSKLIEQMVVAPIIPDSKVGTLPLWGEGGVPLLADDLFGLPSEGKFCQPTATYSDALVWGPTNEIIVWINEDTRLVEGIMAYSSYLGAMKGKFKEGANDVEVVIQPRNKIRIGGAELDEYASRAEASGKPRAWLNTKNVTKIYRSLRETFFGDAPKPADFDCVEQALCDIIFTNSDETVPQDTFIDIQDTGIQLRMAPDGSILFVYAGPVKVAPFEVAGNLGFASGAKPDPRYDSVSLSGCNVGLNDNLTWKTFKQSCIDSERTMNRIAFNVSDSRDSVAVDFNGITLNFMRPKERGVLKDGEAPADDDKLYALTYTRSLSAKTNEFVAMDLAQRYKAKLQARLKQSLLAQCSAPPAPVPPGADDPCQHPFADYQLEIPDSLATEKQRIGELMYMSASGPASWIPAVIKGVQAKY